MVQAYLEVGVISSVNLVEVISRLIDLGATPAEALVQTDSLVLPVHALDERSARRAGELRAVTRHLGLSLGDRASLALAEQMRLPVVTADRAWADLDLGIEVRLIR